MDITISVKIPGDVIDYCEKENINVKKMVRLYKAYIVFLSEETVQEPLDGFKQWLDEGRENF